MQIQIPESGDSPLPDSETYIWSKKKEKEKEKENKPDQTEIRKKEKGKREKKIVEEVEDAR